MRNHRAYYFALIAPGNRCNERFFICPERCRKIFCFYLPIYLRNSPIGKWEGNTRVPQQFYVPQAQANAQKHPQKRSLMNRQGPIECDEDFIYAVSRFRFQTLVQCRMVNASVFDQMPNYISAGGAECIWKKRCEAKPWALQKFIDPVLFAR